MIHAFEGGLWVTRVHKANFRHSRGGGGAYGTLEINNLNRGNNLKLYFSFDNLWHVGEALSPVVGWPHLNSIYTLWDAEVLHVSASFPIFLPLPSPATAHHI